MSLKSLVVESINDNYAYVKYADFDIIMCLKDEYLNMTKIVSLDVTSGNKSRELSDWFRNKHSIEIVDELVSENSPLPYYIITDGPNDLLAS